MIELLSPAGNPETLDAAIGEGADAVYFGLKSFNARMRSSNFAWNQAQAAIQALHRQGKKAYITVNTVFTEDEAERMYRFLHYLTRIEPDGIIVQDLGVIRLVREFFPQLRLHASTQLNIASARGVNALSRMGVSRVVLSRELGIAEIRGIKGRVSAEIEVFVHGALCVSESGLCLFSGYLGGKSANRGMCAQACRRLYTAQTASGERGGYFFSPGDLSLIARVPELVDAGVDAFKIEGRMKSAEYVGAVTAAYRHMLDNYQADTAGALETARRILSTDFGREKTEYWYGFRAKPIDGEPDYGALRAGGAAGTENITAGTLNPEQAGGTGIYLGVLSQVRGSTASLQGGTYGPEAGDTIRLHRKDDTGRESHKVKGITTADGMRRIDIPEGFSAGDPVYLLQTKSMSKHYPHVLPPDLRTYRMQPGGERLPVLDLTPVPPGELSAFPEGIYVAVSTYRDLAAVQSEAAQVVRYILELNHETIACLLDGTPLPAPKKKLFLALDPFCPHAVEDDFAALAAALVKKGFVHWIINNPAQIAMLRGTGAFMVAGPYLYVFNRWAASTLENYGIGAFVSPYENSRENLEGSFERKIRQRVMVPLFANPVLFRIRGLLPASYDFTYFLDKESGIFKALSTVDGSYVLPENPFSIVDMYGKLQSAQFSRFLIDLTKTRVEKRDFKQIMTALYKGAPLKDTTRFNWKDGFWRDKEKAGGGEQTQKTHPPANR
jgi:putative protease